MDVIKKKKGHILEKPEPFLGKDTSRQFRGISPNSGAKNSEFPTVFLSFQMPNAEINNLKHLQPG